MNYELGIRNDFIFNDILLIKRYVIPAEAGIHVFRFKIDYLKVK